MCFAEGVLVRQFQRDGMRELLATSLRPSTLLLWGKEVEASSDTEPQIWLAKSLQMLGPRKYGISLESDQFLTREITHRN